MPDSKPLSKKDKSAEAVRGLFSPPVFLLVGLMLIILFYFLFPTYNLVPFPCNFAGMFIALAGFVLMGKTQTLIKRYNTTLAIEKSSQMITEGVFSKTRNPMYVGMFLLLLGLGLCFRNIFSILTPFGFISILRMVFIPREEKLMHDAFGQDYLDYKNKVRRWI